VGVTAVAPSRTGCEAGAEDGRAEVGPIPNDWRLMKLGDLFDFRNGVNADASAYGRGTPFINVLEVITTIHLTHAEIPGRVTVLDRISESYRVRRGDVLFNRTSETQEEVGLASAYLDDVEVVFGGFVIRARPKTECLDSAFASYMLRSALVRSQIIAKGQGAIRANIGQADLRQVWVPLPDITEQRAIAAAIGDVGSCVRSLQALVAKKRGLKLAVMEELLAAKTRLAGFDSKWSPRSLGELGRWRSGMTPSMANPAYWRDGTVPWLSSSDISQGQHAATASYVTEQAVEENSLPVMPPDSVVLVTRSGILRRFLPVTRIARAMAINQDIRALAPGRDHDPEFLRQTLLHHQDRLLSTCMKPGTTVESLDRNWFNAFTIPMPDVDEQRAIGVALSEMDAEIESLLGLQRKAENVRRGMSQALLAGRTRLRASGWQVSP
jgi:type I restriction enzyme S subunit